MPQPRKQSLPPLVVQIEAIASRIVALRKLRGYSQKKLAEKIGISQPLLASYESGRLHLNDEMIIRFTLALNISADELLGLSANSKVESSTLRIMKRVKKIEQLPPLKQKAILQTLDMALQSSDQNDDL
jgi:transcriptional regulator with XRE-family HTH domain